ncbi:MAG TPA: YibE/F family protein [Candidatus Anaerobutyricum stercoris]|uniref:YibE/F family protein n=1 Tax=Candidatus Anaerobutyricum stercoris TaxID=2838457 RepID=A0A9D2EJ36_9FIRM|nr:YibE/F family protein [Candidatus Anaerobutyricum stercoris]
MNKIKFNGKKIAATAIMLVIYVAVLIYCNNIYKTELIATGGQTYEKATVTEITHDNLQEDGNRYGNQEVMLKIKSGELKGQEVEAISPNGNLFGANCTVGMHVIAMVSISGDTEVVTVYSQDRTAAIYGFAFFFIACVCLIGGWKGFKSILSLAFTGITIFFILFPLIYKGLSPILTSVIICAIATVFSMSMIGGLSTKTVSATIGTIFGVIASAVAALVFGHFAGITGYNVSDIETLNFLAQSTPIRIGELLFSGIIISALGAVTDVGVSVASAIQEIHDTNPKIRKRQLFVSGIHVGRDMMGTMVDTLILAYVGTALSTLVTNYAYDFSYNYLINSNNIGIEIMQSLAGSLGIVLAVPITAFVAVELIYRKPKEEKAVAEQMSDGDNENMPEGISVSEN